jgi:hypothetical protein
MNAQKWNLHAGLMFIAAAAVSAFGKTPDFTSATVWLAVGAVFITLAYRKADNGVCSKGEMKEPL